MPSIKLPKADDYEHLKNIGHNFLQINNDQYGDIMWDEGKTFRILDFKDLDMNQDDTSESTFKRWYEQTVKSNWFAETGEAVDIGGDTEYFNHMTGESEARTGDLLSAQQANEKYGLDGNLTFDRDITVAEAQILHQRKLKEMNFQQMYQMANGFWQRLYGIGAMGVSAMYDPINVGLLFSPDPFTKVGFLGMAAKQGISVARFASTAGRTAIYTAPFEGFVAAQKWNEQADYTLLDSFMAVTLGSAGFGGIHVVGGKTADWLMGVSAKRHSAALDLAYKQALADQDINVDALLKASKDIARKKNYPSGQFLDDVDAAELQRAYNKRTGYVPPQIEYKPSTADEGATIGESSYRSIDLEELPGAPLFEEDFTVTAGKQGSNEGNIVTHQSTGEQWYMKYPKNKEWALNEMIASSILHLILKDGAPKVRPVLRSGKFVGIASKWKEGKPLTMDEVNNLIKTNPVVYKEFLETAMVHAWLGNRDFAAPGNLILSPQGKITSIDAGGSLKFRALGELKDDWDMSTIPELKSFLSGINPDIKFHLDNMNLDMLKNAIAKIYSISDGEIEAIVRDAAKHADAGNQKDFVNELTFALVNRRDSVGNVEIIRRFKQMETDGKKIPPQISEEIKNPAIEPAVIGDIASMEIKKIANRKFIYKKFNSHDEAMKYIDNQIKKLGDDLTPNEKTALMKWAAQSVTHSDVKAYMTGKSTNKAMLVKALLSAINKFETGDNITIYAGKEASNFFDEGILPYGLLNKGDGAKILGMEFSTKSVFNASLLYHKANYFLLKNQQPVKFKIFVPKRTKMAFVDKHASSTAKALYGHEAEVLLPPETRLKIVKANRVQTGERKVWHIDAEIVDPKKSIQTMNMDEILKRSEANYYASKHGPTTSDVKLDPETRALNTRERLQKIESDTDNIDLTNINKEIESLTEELRVYKKDSLDSEVKIVKDETNAKVKKSKSLFDGAKAVLNCVIGKV